MARTPNDSNKPLKGLRNKSSAGTSGTLRIIGGSWRGRKIAVADLPGLRPTTDRVRETLFNWLMMDLRGRNCLDLFAGTGALGLEALSRGAQHCCFIEKHRAAAALVRKACDTLGAGPRARVLEQDAIAFLANGQEHMQKVDVVFVDPPFESDLLDLAMGLLERHPGLAPDALIYIEYPRDTRPAVPSRWSALKEKTHGNVTSALLRADPLG